MTDGDLSSRLPPDACAAGDEADARSLGRALRSLAVLLLAPLLALLLIADCGSPLRYDPASGRVEWSGADHRPSLARIERVDPAGKPAEPGGEGGSSATLAAPVRLPPSPVPDGPWRPAEVALLERSGAAGFDARAPPAG